MTPKLGDECRALDPRRYGDRLCARNRPLSSHVKRARVCSGAAVAGERHPLCGVCRRELHF
eukprot:6145567-Heterocapsa_arctica.AAC.1